MNTTSGNRAYTPRAYQVTAVHFPTEQQLLVVVELQSPATTEWITLVLQLAMVG